MNDDYMEINAELDFKRLDNFLAGKTGKSRSYLSNLIDKGNITQNGSIPRKSAPVKRGDRIIIHFEPEAAPDITPREIPFEILYNGPNYAVINKPAGIAVHPAPGHYDDSLVNGLLYAFSIKDDEADFRPGIVHRLDKDTSGLLLVAKNRDSREILSNLFKDRLIRKHYKAVAWGNPRFKETLVEAPIGRDKKNRQRMAVCENGRYAKTLINVAEQYPKAFLADIELFTGRTHQIRVHMKHIKHPLLGDGVYGGAACEKLFSRQALHASRLTFTDPFTGEERCFEAPLPEDMRSLIKILEIKE